MNPKVKDRWVEIITVENIFDSISFCISDSIKKVIFHVIWEQGQKILKKGEPLWNFHEAITSFPPPTGPSCHHQSIKEIQSSVFRKHWQQTSEKGAKFTNDESYYLPVFSWDWPIVNQGFFLELQSEYFFGLFCLWRHQSTPNQGRELNATR